MSENEEPRRRGKDLFSFEDGFPSAVLNGSDWLVTAVNRETGVKVIFDICRSERQARRQKTLMAKFCEDWHTFQVEKLK
jgi:hypothetical protein